MGNINTIICKNLENDYKNVDYIAQHSVTHIKNILRLKNLCKDQKIFSLIPYKDYNYRFKAINKAHSNAKHEKDQTYNKQNVQQKATILEWVDKIVSQHLNPLEAMAFVLYELMNFSIYNFDQFFCCDFFLSLMDVLELVDFMDIWVIEFRNSMKQLRLFLFYSEILMQFILTNQLDISFSTQKRCKYIIQDLTSKTKSIHDIDCCIDLHISARLNWLIVQMIIFWNPSINHALEYLDRLVIILERISVMQKSPAIIVLNHCVVDSIISNHSIIQKRNSIMSKHILSWNKHAYELAKQSLSIVVAPSIEDTHKASIKQRFHEIFQTLIEYYMPKKSAENTDILNHWQDFIEEELKTIHQSKPSCSKKGSGHIVQSVVTDITSANIFKGFIFDVIANE